MQNQREFDPMSNTPEETPAPLNERRSNADPREQPPSQEYTYRSYEEGYTDQSERITGRSRVRSYSQSRKTRKVWADCWHW